MDFADADSCIRFAALHENVGSMYSAFIQGREDELCRVIGSLRAENISLRGDAATPECCDGVAAAEVGCSLTAEGERMNKIVARLLPKVDAVEEELEALNSRMSSLATGSDLGTVHSKISALATGFQAPQSRQVSRDIALPNGQFQVWDDWTAKANSTNSRRGHALHFEDFDEWLSGAFLDKRVQNLRREYTQYQANTHSAYVMHPSSSYRLGWELISMGFLFYDLIAIPLMAFNPSGLLTDIMDWITCIFWTFDLLFAFRTGYYEKSGSVMLHSRMIFMHYLRTWFVFDVVVISIDWSFVTGITTSSVFRYGKLMRGLRLLRLLRLVRIMKMKNISEEVQMRLNSEYASLVMGVVKYLLVILLLGHFIACAWFGVGNMVENLSWIDKYFFRDKAVATQYMVCLHWSLTQFTPASMPVQPVSDVERGFAIFVVVFGLIVYGSFVSSITSTMTHLRELSARRNTQFWKLRRFLTERQISRRLTLRITKYLTVMASRQSEHVHENQVEILGLLSVPLRQRLNREVYSPKLEIHPLFDFLSKRRQTTFMSLCCNALTQDQFSKGDVLFHANVAAVSMFIVADGSFIYIPADQKIAPTIMMPGSWFSEAVLWMPWVHRGTMCSYEVTSAVEMHGGRFREAMQIYPDDVALAQAYAAAFVKLMRETEDALLLDIEPCAEVLADIVSTVTNDHAGEQSIDSVGALSVVALASDDLTTLSVDSADDATDLIRV